jgi:hypothetical protein
MKQTIRAVAEQKERTGTFNGFAFVGYEYEEGWLVSLSSGVDESTRLLWVDGTFAALRFSVVAPNASTGLGLTEVNAEPINVTADVKEAVLAMIWEWEVWEPITVAGTCAIDSLVRMLDLPQETLLHWFRIAGRNPSVPEEIILTLEENGYIVDEAGPEGFGKFHEHHRLVAMYRKDDPQNGHVILIYAFDKGVFDAAGVFKEVSHILWSDRYGYNRGFVWRIQKR